MRLARAGTARHDVRRCRGEILNHFDSRLTNGRSEATNLIIKIVNCQDYGYRNFEHYRLRVLYRCS